MEILANRQCTDLELVKLALDRDPPDTQLAGDICRELLADDPDNTLVLFWMARVFLDTDMNAEALAIGRQLVATRPKEWQGWFVIGMAESYLQRYSRSTKALYKANKMWPNDHGILAVLGNALVMSYDWTAMRYARQSLKLKPEDNHQAHTVLAFGHLHQREWADGWRELHHQMGHVPFRDKQDYGLPEWEGQPGKVLVYAEQGLGDQLAFMSAIKPHELICHPKLTNVFNRVFPNCHGDQFTPVVDWPVTSDYQCSMGSAMQYVEMKQRGRYLNPCPLRRTQWRALIDGLGSRRKIGIAWTGGKIGSHGYKGRNLTLEQLLPILSIDAHFISLEYKDCTADIDAFYRRYGIRIHNWPWGTQTADYGDTAALMDCLDAVVTVPTTAYHLAGALGIPAHVLVHSSPHWHEGTEGPSPWWKSVEFYRRPILGTDTAIKQIAEKLQHSL